MDETMNKTVFLMIARLLYDKGYREYADAARFIRQERSDVECQLLGSIDEAYPNHVPETVVQQDNDAGYIYYLGYASDVRPFVRRADCIVLPSYHEGLSRVLMEALAMGKPIITSDISGCRETVDDGRNGYLVPPRDAEALAEAMRRFLALTPEEKSRMGQYGRRKAEEQFDVRKVIALYRQITG